MLFVCRNLWLGSCIFLCNRKLRFHYIKKRSARIALRRIRNMSHIAARRRRRISQARFFLYLQTKPQYMILITFKTDFFQKTFLKFGGKNDEEKNDGSSIDNGNGSNNDRWMRKQHRHIQCRKQHEHNREQCRRSRYRKGHCTEYCRQNRVQSWNRTVCR